MKAPEIRVGDSQRRCIGLGNGGQWPVTPAALWHVDCVLVGALPCWLKYSVWETDRCPLLKRIINRLMTALLTVRVTRVNGLYSTMY